MELHRSTGDDPVRGDYHGQILVVNLFIFGVLALGFVTLRITRRIITRKTSMSDWLLVISLASSIAQDILNGLCVARYGLGHHKRDLPHAIRMSPVYLQLLWLNQLFFKLTTATFKLSICHAYYDLFKRYDSRLFRVTRTVTSATALLVTGYYGAAFFTSIFQCAPVSKSWYPKQPGKCINLDEFRYYTAATNIITSVLIIATPLPALYKTRHMGREVKEVMGLVLLGLIHTACTIVRLVIMKYPDSAAKTDPQWTSVTPLTIAIVEMDIGIIAASLVVMRPCLKAICNGLGTFWHTARNSSHPDNEEQRPSDRNSEVQRPSTESWHTVMVETAEFQLENQNILIRGTTKVSRL